MAHIPQLQPLPVPLDIQPGLQHAWEPLLPSLRPVWPSKPAVLVIRVGFLSNSDSRQQHPPRTARHARSPAQPVLRPPPAPRRHGGGSAQRPGPGSRCSPTEPGTPLPSRPRTAAFRRDGSRPSLGSAALCPPRLALFSFPFLSSPALLVSPSGDVGAVSPPGLLLPAHPGTALSPAGSSGHRRSRRSRRQENGRLFPAEQAPVQLLPSSRDHLSCRRAADGHSTCISAPLPTPKPMVISLLEGGEEPWIPDVRSPEAVPGDLSPAGTGIADTLEDLEESGVAERRWGGVCVEEMRRDVQGGLEQGQGEHIMEPLGKGLGKTGRSPLDFNVGQKEIEEPRSKDVCQQKKQNPCTECGKTLK
ncbi:uncharacterized protein LOC125686088 [Lagopus muta]|uniref:uncharacterized protein LOC125686088 n=1 Tax=Lagopus muta TaxID=64668 RepID=UPI0020A020CD|nr:uncharacterized protein LOC125686088 [Lagopus muta]